MRDVRQKKQLRKNDLNRAAWLFETCLWYFPGGSLRGIREMAEREFTQKGKK